MRENYYRDELPSAPCPFEKLYPSQLERDDTFFMKLAYNQAIEAWKRGEVPVGALIVLDGEIIGKASNSVEGSGDPTAHAEILAISQACRHTGDWRLSGATLYVTKEPCPMCSGAALLGRVSRVVFAFADPNMGGLGGAAKIHRLPQSNHRFDVQEGILRDECLALLRSFFEIKRGDSRP